MNVKGIVASGQQYFMGAEQDALDRKLALHSSFGEPIGIDAANAQAALARRGLAQLAQFQPQSLGPVQKTSAAVMRCRLEKALERTEFATHRLVFHQMLNSLQVDLINALTQVHPIRSERDIENYLVRLRQVSLQIDKGVDEARKAEAAGVIPPRFILERTLGQFDEFLNTPAASNVLVTSLGERIDTLPKKLPGSQRASYVMQAEGLVKAQVMPAYLRARNLLASQLEKATDDAGVWRLPRGDEFYALQLETATTTQLSAAEIHQIGLREVAAIEAEMDRLLRQLGSTRGTMRNVRPEVAAQCRDDRTLSTRAGRPRLSTASENLSQSLYPGSAFASVTKTTMYVASHIQGGRCEETYPRS